MKSTTKKENSNIPVLIICVIAFIGLWIIQGKVQSRPNEAMIGVQHAMEGLVQKYSIEKGDSMSVLGPLQGFSRSGNASVQGIIAQIQVLLSIILVLTNNKKGFIAAVALNLANALHIFIFSFLLGGAKSFPPGIVISLVTVATISFLYAFLAKNHKITAELSESYQKAIEDNRIIQEKDEVLNYLAYYDRLTQMPNRQKFLDELEKNITAGNECTVVYVDLDDFRAINDNFGHSTGDDILVQYAQQIEELCGDEHFAAKIGGDEFGIILGSGLTNDDIVSYVSSISDIFARPVDIRGDQFTLTASFGAATFPTDARSSEDLFRCAETAMFTSKSNGKNQLCFYRRGF